MKTSEKVTTIADVKITNQTASFEPAVDYPSNAGWFKKNGNVYLSGEWIKKHTLLNEDVQDSEYYLSTLTPLAVRNIEKGIFALDAERYLNEERYTISFGDTNARIKILIGDSWVSVRPVDHFGYYEEAKELGY